MKTGKEELWKRILSSVIIISLVVSMSLTNGVLAEAGTISDDTTENAAVETDTVTTKTGIAPDPVEVNTIAADLYESERDAKPVDETDPAPEGEFEASYVNPVYEDIVSVSIKQEPRLAPEPQVADTYYSTIEEAAAQMRQEMKKRSETIVVGYSTTDTHDGSLAKLISDEAITHTGVPTEGDYLKFQYGGWEASISYNTKGGKKNYSITYAMKYYTNAEQEAEMDAKVKTTIASLDLEDKTDYSKIKSIYDYICSNVVYDYDHLSDSSYKLQFTAYGALVNGTSVCQGYAVLFYRLALEAGVDARVISGIGTPSGSEGGPHGWNIVELKDKYYYVDSTWDAGRSTYSYFLKGTKDFPEHESDDEYLTDSFQQEYPIAETAYEKTDEDDEVHNWVLKNQKDSTCTEEGYTGDTVCSDCGAIKEKGETIPMKDHTWEAEYTVDRVASCTEKGSKSIHCSVCDTVKEGSQVEIPETDHNWDAGKVTKEASCTEAGVKTYTCTSCKTTKTETIAAAGHSFGDWKVIKEADCTEKGSEERVCSACGEKETREIAAKGHTWESDYTIDKEATCTEKGSKSIHCSVCDVIKEGSQTEIPLTDHKWDAGKITKEATCTEAGIEESVCSVCGEKETREIPATGHSYGDWTVAKEATSTEAGTEESVCSACGEKETRERPATGHSYGDWTVVKEATCTEAGTEERVCSICGEKETREIPATGHSFGDWTVEKEATATEDGLEKRVCSNCQEEETRIIPRTGTGTAMKFTDVHKGDWFYDAVAYVNERGLMTGLNETTFGPAQTLARAQFAVILYRMEGEPDVSYRNVFPDVPDGIWYTDAIMWASENGIITGYTNTGKFGPADKITREQMAVMMYRYAQYKKYDTSEKADFSKFDDASRVSGYAKEAMQWAVGTGIITGKYNGTRIDPLGSANRAECATIIMRFVEKYE